MNDDVLRQVSHIDKCLVAHVTLVWADVVMMPNVIGQLTGLHKPGQRDRQIYMLSFQNIKKAQFTTTYTVGESEKFYTTTSLLYLLSCGKLTFYHNDHTRRASLLCAGGHER